MIPQASPSRHPPLLAILALAALAALVGVAASGCRAAESLEPAAPLGIGTTDRPIAPGEVHRYTIDVRQARALALELEQVGLDLELSAEGPGAEPLTVDNPRKLDRPETLVWVARRRGPVTVTVRPLASDGSAGSYRLRAEEPRPASREDFAAQRGFRWYQRGRSAEDEGELAVARVAFLRAADEFRKAGNELAQSWAWHKVGRVWETEPADPNRAESAFRRALDLERRVGGGRALASALNSFAGRLARSSSTAVLYEALALQAEAREILARGSVDDPFLELRLLLGQASAEAKIRRPHAALGLYQQALERALELGAPEWECSARLGISRILRRSGDLRGAYQACRDCLKAPDEPPATSRAVMLTEMAGIELDLERPRRALRHLHEAEGLSDADSERRRLHDLGRALARLKRYVDAQVAFSRALERAGSPDEEHAIRIDSAYAHHLAGDHERAYGICDEVLASALEAGDTLAITSAHHCMARTLAARDRPLDALKHIRTAVGQVEELRLDLAQDRLRSLFLASRREYYELYVRVLLDLADRSAPGRTPEDWREWAFEVAEASKARTLYDGLVRNRAESGGDRELLAREQLLEEEIAQLEIEHLRGGAPALGHPDGVSYLEDELRRHHRELDRVRGALRAGRAGWREALALRPANVDEIRRDALADGRTQILAYFLGHRESYVWVLGQETVAVRRLPRRQRIERQAEKVAQSMATARASYELAQAEVEAEELAGLILAPVGEELTAERLIVVKEGTLLDVPFSALRLGRDLDDSYLDVRFTLVEAYSASTALALRRSRPWRPRSNGRIAVVGDAVFACTDPRLRDSRSCTEGRSGGWGFGLSNLPRLDGSREEARTVADLAADRDPLLLLGHEARAERVLDGDLSPFEILHLATHGFSVPTLSGLVFSQHDPAGREIDGLVREWQVYDLELAADLVVLSACRTGRGSPLTGESASSLARAFLWAGASTVVASLWDVDDDATRYLMDRFYRELLVSEEPPAEALRLAQAAVRAQPQWSAPRYWAGFVVQGDWR